MNPNFGLKSILSGRPRLLATGLLLLLATGITNASPLLNVNYRQLVSRADLDYTTPAGRSEDGMPVGNGRMGSLVWTTPFALKFQINRIDVFGEDSSTVSFPRADSDYAGGCGYVDINVVQAGDNVFTGKAFHQHLSLYDGLMTAQGNGVTARVLAWPQRDVMAVQIDDQRPRPESINVDLRMLRYAMQRVTGRNYELATNHAVLVRTAEQTALSKLDVRNGRILLIQQFRENAFYDSSAVAISVVGRRSKARYLNGATVELCVPPGKGRFTILISSAASFDPTEDVGGAAVVKLQAAESLGFPALQSQTADWWHDFWRQGFVYMHSVSGQADFVEENYTYFIYLMGASSRGDYPPRFGGMLWRTTGDLSRWGSQYWWANTSAYYNNLMPANRLELMDPMFSMYSGMYGACAVAARQQWGSKGIWIPETTFFNGPQKLPGDIAAELRALMLARKPYSERSARFQWWVETKNRHNSRYNFQADGHWDHGHWVVPNKGHGIFGHTTHILSDAAKIADLYWQRYRYTMDTNWLRHRAYPMIKGAAEFYRNFPNLQKGADGKYHIHHVNNGEGSWDSSDTPTEIGAMHLIFPLAIRASKILGVDADLRPLWKQINNHLATPQAGGKRHGTDRPYGAFVYNGPGAIKPIGPQPELKRRFLGFDRLGSFIDAKGTGGAQILRNRLRLREGPGAIDAEHLGGLAAGIHSTMLSSEAEMPNGEPVISVINRWPKGWDAAFKLRAQGAFVVRSAQLHGKIPFVEIHSLAGTACHLVNPWPGVSAILYRDGRETGDLTGNILTFATQKGETDVVTPGASLPSTVEVPELMPDNTIKHK